MDWMPAPAVTVPDGVMLTVPVMDPVMALPVLWSWKPVGPVPGRLVPVPVPVELTSVMADAGPTNAAVALIPDAAAAGAAMAVTITGTDQATPLTTLRRLNPPCSSLLVTSAFMTSDNCAPDVVHAGAGPLGPAEDFAAFSPASPTLPNGPKGSRKRSERFAQDFLNVQLSARAGVSGSVCVAASSRARWTRSSA